MRMAPARATGMNARAPERSESYGAPSYQDVALGIRRRGMRRAKARRVVTPADTHGRMQGKGLTGAGPGADMETLSEATRGAVRERAFFELSWSHRTWMSSTGGSLVGIGGACSRRARGALAGAGPDVSPEVPPVLCADSSWRWPAPGPIRQRLGPGAGARSEPSPVQHGPPGREESLLLRLSLTPIARGLERPYDRR